MPGFSPLQPTRTVAAFDAGIAQQMSFGVAGATFTSADASGGPAAVTDVPTTAQKLVITDLEISAGATAQQVTLTEETSGTIVGRFFVGVNTTVIVQTRGRRKLATAGKRLMVQTLVAGAIAVTAHYYSEP
jgi:hypothetical protein